MVSYKKTKNGATERLNYYEQHYIERLKNAALSMFNWKNLPNTIDRWFLEVIILENGTAAIFKVKDTGVLMGGSYTMTRMDNYGYPTTIRGVLNPGQTGSVIRSGLFDVDGHDFEVVFDSNTRMPLFRTIQMHARKLALMSVQMETNLARQATPFFITTESPQTRASAVALYNDISENGDLVLTSMEPDSIRVFQTGVPLQAKEYQDAIEREYQLALAEMGVFSQNTKNERMVTDEVNFNQQADLVRLNSRYQNRKEFVERVNKRFGTNIEVEVVGMVEVDGLLQFKHPGNSGNITESKPSPDAG